MQLNIFGDNDKAKSLAVAAAESINCYTVKHRGSISGDVLVGCSGHSLVANLPGTTMRGAAVVGNLGFFLSGTNLYKMDDQQVITLIGNIPGNGRVSIADDGISVIILNGTTSGFYYNIDTDTFSVVALPYVGYTLDYVMSFIAISSDDERWFLSNVNNSDAFDAFDAALAEKDSDEILALVELHGDLFLLGERTIEPWYYTGATEFGFARNTSNVIERGIYGRHAFVKEDNTLFFLGDDLVVYQLSGYSLNKISDIGLETELTGLAANNLHIDLSNTNFISYTENGCKFLQMNVPNQMSRTLNLSTGLWFTREYWETNNALSNCYIRLRGRHYVGGVNGDIYEMSTNLYTDADKPLKRLRRTNFISEDNRILNFKKIKFFMDFGTTPVYDGSQGTDPKLMLRQSFDGANSWRSVVHLDLGQAGRYNNICTKHNFGAARNRIIEFSVTDPVPFNVMQVTVDIV